MISLTRRAHGFTIQLQGLVDLEEMRTLVFQMRDEWAGMEEEFVLVVDARAFTLFTADAQADFETLLEEGLERGLVRITVLAISTALAGLFCNLMVRTEAMPLYQFLDLAYEEDFRSEMNAWLHEPFENAAQS